MDLNIIIVNSINFKIIIDYENIEQVNDVSMVVKNIEVKVFNKQVEIKDKKDVNNLCKDNFVEDLNRILNFIKD